MVKPKSGEKVPHPFFDVSEEDRPQLPFSDYYQVGMGTEHVAPFLYSIVRMVRPRRMLEVGVGYTSVWLLKAIEDNQTVHIDWNSDHTYFQKDYDPVVICIDDADESGSILPENFEKLNQHKACRILKQRFQGSAKEIYEEFGYLDFVWFDCGGPEDYSDFCTEFLPICNGLVLFHFTYLRGVPNKNHDIISGYLEEQRCKDGYQSWDQIDLVEPHKYRQGSVTMLKRKTPLAST